MKIVVVRGTGLVGRKLVAALEAEGHTAVAASPSTGVDTWTGAGLAEALDGAAVMVDVSNPPSFEDSLDFFTQSLLRGQAGTGGAGEPAAGSATHELAGPEVLTPDEFGRRVLSAAGVPRSVVTDATADTIGVGAVTDALIPAPAVGRVDRRQVAPKRLAEWSAAASGAQVLER